MVSLIVGIVVKLDQQTPFTIIKPGRQGVQHFPGWSGNITYSPEARNYFPSPELLKKKTHVRNCMDFYYQMSAHFIRKSFQMMSDVNIFTAAPKNILGNGHSQC